MTTPWIIAFALLWSTVGLMAFTLLGLLRRAVAVLEATDLELEAQGWRPSFGGAPHGTVIPEFFVADRAGAQVAWTDLLGDSRVWVFLESHCPPCRQLVSELERSPRFADEVPLAVIMDDSDAGRSYPFPPGTLVFYQADRLASIAFQSSASPHGFAVDAQGRVVDTAIPNTVNDLRRLARAFEGGDEKNTTRESLATAI
jgi:hypothetical protein